jgi:thiol-disulfide isomerase/thioredoxin
MKHLLRSIFLSLAVLLLINSTEAQDDIHMLLEFAACEKPPSLYRYKGFDFELVTVAEPAGEPDQYRMTLPKGAPQFYFIGQLGKPVRPIILGPEDGIALTGSCENATRGEFEGSPLNEAYEALKADLNEFRQRTSRQIMAYRQARSDEERQEIIAQMDTLDQEKKNFLDSLQRTAPFLGKVAALETYLSYLNHREGNYRDELEYFANEYFQFVDFSDEAYRYSPAVVSAFRAYTQTIAGVGLADERQKAYLEQALSKTPAGSSTRMLAYRGILNVLERRNIAVAAAMATRFLEDFPNAEGGLQQKLQQIIDQASTFIAGNVAPGFTQETPEGDLLSLADLRGKVVLVDFWASWCGPCRRENPNVVRMYRKYNDKGFEILGVSLDKDRNRWLQAIEQDGLEWYHVSDLKGWQNEVAQAYRVSSIPQTVLLDEEGRIIARNLRGVALERKLEEIFVD